MKATKTFIEQAFLTDSTEGIKKEIWSIFTHRAHTGNLLFTLIFYSNIESSYIVLLNKKFYLPYVYSKKKKRFKLSIFIDFFIKQSESKYYTRSL